MTSPDSGLPAVLTDGANPGVTSLWPNTAADTDKSLQLGSWNW